MCWQMLSNCYSAGLAIASASFWQLPRFCYSKRLANLRLDWIGLRSLPRRTLRSASPYAFPNGAARQIDKRTLRASARENMSDDVVRIWSELIAWAKRGGIDPRVAQAAEDEFARVVAAAQSGTLSRADVQALRRALARWL